MKLEKLLNNIEYELLQGNIDKEITYIIYDSRKIKKDSAFVALVGYNTDGHKYIDDAIEKGASTLFVERKIKTNKDVTIIKVKNTRNALAILSSNYFDNPAKKLIMIGITGTKGKTTTTFMIKKILEQSSKKVGIIGTNGVYYNNVKHIIGNTTPESYEIHEYLKEMVDNNIEYVVMEVSSQALKFNRVDGIIFDYGVFTNLTHDHISDFEHPNMEDYINSKAKLFQICKHGVLNIDDENYDKMVENATCDIFTFGYNDKANICIKIVELTHEGETIGINMKLTGAINDTVIVSTPGKFSSYNAACAIAVTHLLGATSNDMKKALINFSVKGRVEPVPIGDKKTFIIDYAHNGVSMESILTTMRDYHPKRLITIFGCGGNRSKDRRYEMGRVSGTLADLSIVTSDNPRFENPDDIINDILITLKETNGKYITIPDRREAIKFAVDNSCEGDIILLLGKGHEDYQEIEGIKYHFDDRETVEEILNQKS